MSCFTEKFRKLERLDALTRRLGTGSPDELAQRLNVSVRTLHNYINDLRCLGAEIKFCPDRCTYYYVQPFQLFGHTQNNTSLPPPHFRRLSNFFGPLQKYCSERVYF